MVFRAFCWFLTFTVPAIAEESYIELYDGANFGGDKYVLNEGDEELLEFNDKASSFKVSSPDF